jgi:hypothetical protein
LPQKRVVASLSLAHMYQKHAGGLPNLAMRIAREGIPFSIEV